MEQTMRSVSRIWKVVPRYGTLSSKSSGTSAARVRHLTSLSGLCIAHIPSDTLSVTHGVKTRHNIKTINTEIGQTDPNSSFSSGSGDSQSRLTVASIIASGRLPEPALGIISDLDTAIKAIAKTIHGRERICEYILNEVCCFWADTLIWSFQWARSCIDPLAYIPALYALGDDQDYIKALIDVMEQAEDLESLPDLHAMHGIIQTIRKSILRSGFSATENIARPASKSGCD